MHKILLIDFKICSAYMSLFEYICIDVLFKELCYGEKSEQRQ